MFRYADTTSLMYPLQELQQRLSLELPASYLKSELLSGGEESSTKASYSVTHYRTEDDTPDGAQLDAEPIIESLARDVFSEHEDVSWDIQTNDVGRNTRTTTVSAYRREESMDRKASPEQVDSVPYDVIPLTVYAEDRVYNLATDGNTYVLLKDGKIVIEDAPSPAYALGRMVALLRDELTDIEANEGIEPSPPNDFLAGMALAVIDTPEISDEAKEHFVKFYELATLTDWGAVKDGADGEDD